MSASGTAVVSVFETLKDCRMIDTHCVWKKSSFTNIAALDAHEAAPHTIPRYCQVSVTAVYDPHIWSLVMLH